MTMPTTPNKPKTGPSGREKLLSRLQSEIGHTFVDRLLLFRALGLPSQSSGLGKIRNERDRRMGFCGNALLALLLSDRLLRIYPDGDEGYLTRMRESLAERGVLSNLAERIGLDRLVFSDRAKGRIHGKARTAALAESLEALIGALYLDGGLPSAEEFVGRLFEPLMERFETAGGPRDYKTKLQELSHSLRYTPPRYLLKEVSGKEGDFNFTVWVVVGNDYFAKGSGKTRKEAEQIAAREALLLLEEERTVKTGPPGKDQ